MQAVPQSYVFAARLLAIAGLVQAAVYFLFGFENFEVWMRGPVAAWVAAPLAIAYGAAIRLVRGRVAFAFVLAAMAIAFAVSAWIYWEITWGETARRESLAGLNFLFVPFFQFVALAVTIGIAWLTGRRAKAS